MRPVWSQQARTHLDGVTALPDATQKVASLSRALKSILVNPLVAIVRLFVNTFGITQPAPEAEARAGRVILAMLFGVLAVIAAIAWALRSTLLH
jgi:hypothetical protein